MASFAVSLTPTPVAIISEGSLDTSVLNGLSLQRTVESFFVVNGANEKMLYRLKDGETYDNTTFETVVSTIPLENPNLALLFWPSCHEINIG